MNLEKYKVGDEIIIVSSQTLGIPEFRTIKELIFKQDKISGEEFPVIVMDNDQQFDVTTGNAITAPYNYTLLN
jgi:hypothetical protein